VKLNKDLTLFSCQCNLEYFNKISKKYLDVEGNKIDEQAIAEQCKSE
jgi:hypothetical protein